MLTVRYPEVIYELKDFHAGLWPCNFSDGSMALIIKYTKEAILAAKMTGNIRLYVVPAPVDTYRFAGVITGFFDDSDEPLILTSPLFEGDFFTRELFALLSSRSFDVHLFDENNHELLGYRARNPACERFRALAEQSSFARFSDENITALLSHMAEWFALRTRADDVEAFPIEFVEPLFPDDIVLLDLTETLKTIHGHNGLVVKTLERQHAGPMQEMDIFALLRRVFPRERIYLNPMRTDYPHLEFADVVVATENYLYIIQAKDSPNTEAMLRRTMERKRSVAIAHLKKAVSQLGGAIKYTRSKEPFTITTGGVTHTIDLQSRIIIGLIVLKEMFDADAAAYARPTFQLGDDTGVRCLVMDYTQLHIWTLKLPEEAAFLNGLQMLLNAALENGVFPRVRFRLIEKT